MSPDRTLTVNGAAATFTAAGAVAINGAYLYAQGGATLSLPGLYSHADTSGCCGSVFEAIGAGSVLNLSSLTNFTGNPTWAMAVNAKAGGQVLFSNLTRIEVSLVNFYADGTNSAIGLPLLTTYPGSAGRLSFDARNAAHIDLPQLTSAQRMDFARRSGGVIPLTQLTTASLATVTVDDGTALTFTGLTNLNGT
jgi:hypothetical protein